MAIFRKIHTSFWSDSFIQDLDKDQKLFYLYILTNERTRQCGVYEITKKQISFDLGYNIDRVSILLDYFIKVGKLKYNDVTKELAIGNWLKYNNSTSPKVKSCIDKEFGYCKDRVLIEYVKSIDTLSQEEEEQEEEQEEEIIDSIEQRKKKFGESLSAYQGVYNREMLLEFYDYWREPNKSKTKMLFETKPTWDLPLRLKRWHKNNEDKKPQPKRIDWEIEKFNFLNDDTWRMRIAQEYKASKEQFDSCISCFIKDIEDKDDYKDVAGLKKHFINHIRKNGINCKKELQPTSSIGLTHIPNYDTPEKLAVLLDKYK